jgi:DNA-binding CsgD family transcriptional regulator
MASLLPIPSAVLDDTRERALGPVHADRFLEALPGGVTAADAQAKDMVLRGRRRECEALDGLLEGVRGGDSQVLVLRGEPGVGKSALLEYAIERASGCRVVRAAGVQSEMELAFAGLHQLCVPLLDRVELLPGPQRDALGTALGLRDGEAPDRFFLGLAVLGLLREAAAGRPLICFVDDAQWLDRTSAQVLAFVARRLAAESVAIVFTMRRSGEEDELAGLPELEIEGLRDRDARALLASVIKGRLDERVRDRIVAETGGNPLALLELPRGMTPAELAGGFGLPDALPLAGQIEESFRRRLMPLPQQTRQLLLLAAAEPLGDALLVWGAARRLGIGVDAAAPATGAGLAEFGCRVRFRHPLVRSAVYRAATPEERMGVHRALAEATDPDVDPDRRAWHRAQAAAGPDEGIAEELARSAGRAQARGGLAAAAALLEQAAQLTAEPARRAQRALVAAQATHDAGSPEAALDLLATAQAGPLDAVERARVDLLRARIALAVNRSSDAPSLLLKAARELEPLDPGLARETYLEAFSAAMFVGALSNGDRVAEVARAARTAPPPPWPPRAPDLLLDGLALLITEGPAAGAPTLKRALRAFCDEDASTADGIRWLWLACHTAGLLWDDKTCDLLSARYIRRARDAGALTALPLALSSRIVAQVCAGKLGAAASLIKEIEAVSDAKERHRAVYSALPVAACQGRQAETAQLLEAATSAAVSRGEGIGLTLVDWSAAMFYNGLGRYDEALAAASRAGEPSADLRYATWALPELVEAAVRSGMPDVAGEALARLAQTSRASGTDWALGIEARSRALLSAGPAAEDLYRDAVDRLGRTGAGACLARAHLLYGEWLRQEGRRQDAREQLRVAHDLFAAMGIEGFARRAARELLATGETTRKRTAEANDELTAQEAEIARLARDGLSNRDIGARLFISPRTVEYHLHKVFAKLAITSRKHLDDALTGEPEVARAV